MKRETKNVLIVSIVSFVLIIGMVITGVLLRQNVASGEKKDITLRIIYSEKTYEYTNLRTDGNTVFDLLEEYNEKLALGMEYTVDPVWGAFITSFKSTGVDENRKYYYTYTIDRIEYAEGVSMQPVLSGDVITFRYSCDTYDNDTFELLSSILQKGGDGKLTYYQKMFITFAIIGGVVLAAAASYIVIEIVKGRKARKIED